jgi:hypothetical protein
MYHDVGARSRCTAIYESQVPLPSAQGSARDFLPDTYELCLAEKSLHSKDTHALDTLFENVCCQPDTPPPETFIADRPTPRVRG